MVRSWPSHRCLPLHCVSHARAHACRVITHHFHSQPQDGPRPITKSGQPLAVYYKVRAATSGLLQSKGSRWRPIINVGAVPGGLLQSQATAGGLLQTQSSRRRPIAKSAQPLVAYYKVRAAAGCLLQSQGPHALKNSPCSRLPQECGRLPGECGQPP